MNILLVYGNMELGGIQTLILRMCRYLQAHNHDITLLLDRAQGGELLEAIVGYARVLVAEQPDWWGHCPKSLRGERFSYIYSFDSISLLRALAVQASCSPNAKVVVGVYFPREYCWKSEEDRYAQRLVKDILRRIPEENIIFMNATNAVELGQCLGRQFSCSPIIPIPIELRESREQWYALDRARIVSVGRITDFKTYNFHMVDVVQILRARGHELRYDVYGYGEQEGHLHAYVEERGLMKQVQLHGPVRYSALQEVLHGALVFVGMGTALLEAAALGVPALVAVESARTPVTYGFFQEMPEDDHNLGEADPGYATYPLVEKIEWLLGLSPKEYARLREKTQNRAKRHALEQVMPRFLEALHNARSFHFPLPPSARWRHWADLWHWRALKRLGAADPLEGRYLAKSSDKTSGGVTSGRKTRGNLG